MMDILVLIMTIVVCFSLVSIIIKIAMEEVPDVKKYIECDKCGKLIEKSCNKYILPKNRVLKKRPFGVSYLCFDCEYEMRNENGRSEKNI